VDSDQVARFAQVGAEPFDCCRRPAAPVRDVLHPLYEATHGNQLPRPGPTWFRDRFLPRLPIPSGPNPPFPQPPTTPKRYDTPAQPGAAHGRARFDPGTRLRARFALTWGFPPPETADPNGIGDPGPHSRSAQQGYNRGRQDDADHLNTNPSHPE